MSTIASVTSTPTPISPAPTTASRVPQKTLGQDDFMKLLAVQFQQQDPMKPMEDTAFIAQMAQFSALQQSSAMTTALGDMRADQNRAIANSYLGHHVTVDAGNGNTANGDVAGIQMVNGAPQLIVGGQTYPISAVLLVEPSGVTAPQPASAGGA